MSSTKSQPPCNKTNALCGRRGCGKPVKTGMQCESCTKWFHTLCTGLSVKQYVLLENSDAAYICLACRVDASLKTPKVDNNTLSADKSTDTQPWNNEEALSLKLDRLESLLLKCHATSQAQLDDISAEIAKMKAFLPTQMMAKECLVLSNQAVLKAASDLKDSIARDNRAIIWGHFNPEVDPSEEASKTLEALWPNRPKFVVVAEWLRSKGDQGVKGLLLHLPSPLLVNTVVNLRLDAQRKLPNITNITKDRPLNHRKSVHPLENKPMIDKLLLSPKVVLHRLSQDRPEPDQPFKEQSVHHPSSIREYGRHRTGLPLITAVDHSTSEKEGNDTQHSCITPKKPQKAPTNTPGEPTPETNNWTEVKGRQKSPRVTTNSMTPNGFNPPRAITKSCQGQQNSHSYSTPFFRVLEPWGHQKVKQRHAVTTKRPLRCLLPTPPRHADSIGSCVPARLSPLPQRIHGNYQTSTLRRSAHEHHYRQLPTKRLGRTPTHLNRELKSPTYHTATPYVWNPWTQTSPLGHLMPTCPCYHTQNTLLPQQPARRITVGNSKPRRGY